MKYDNQRAFMQIISNKLSKMDRKEKKRKNVYE